MIARSIQLRNQGRSEAVLRSEVASRLRQIFPDDADQSWVNHYTEGSEALTRIGSGPKISNRFIDNLVRSTVIEYEADLRREAIFKEGLRQLYEYSCGVIRSGTPASQVRCLLSDTVDWQVFDVRIKDGVSPSSCSIGDIELIRIERVELTSHDDEAAEMFIRFLRKHLAREQSRPLGAVFITADLGLQSTAYRRHVDMLRPLVDDGRSKNSSIKLATDLWSKFVDYLESHGDKFRTNAYVDEAYIAILARLLCANILQRHAEPNNNRALTDILTGQFFENQFHLNNMVEQDYFGWMLRAPYLDSVLPIAHEIQRDLYAYDFLNIKEEDLFGHLMAQLARLTQRKLLGQEWTPQWVAKCLAEKCMDSIPSSEKPQIVDMCCGSGAIIAEILKAARNKRPGISFSDLYSAATGFDIDPLAVLLAKTTWVITLANEVRASTEPITIPIYHADSLFSVTPLTTGLPLPGEMREINIELDGDTIVLPLEIISPEYRSLFDEAIDWVYDESKDAQKKGNVLAITFDRVSTILDSLLEKNRLQISDNLKKNLYQSVYALAKRMASLAVANRNGIWAFILRNTYRPGLLAGQFNGLVSNPPWLAMSQLADNPYKEQLTIRAQAYGIKPGGAAHLHLELATTHLIHAVDRYLKSGATFACLAPGTIFNGQHQANFRDAKYLDAPRSVPLEIQEVWSILPGTFKVRAAAIIGQKKSTVAEVDSRHLKGAFLNQDKIDGVPIEIHRLGRRTAWVLGGPASSVHESSSDVPPQGADLMPRPAVCIEVIDQGGTEWRVQTPRRSDSGYFAVKDAKKLKNENFDGAIAPCFIYRMAQSLNLLPFSFDDNFVRIAVPARRNRQGEWEILEASQIRTEGFTQTARRFQRIDQSMKDAGIRKPLGEYINERNKLAVQIFPANQFLVASGAGGGVACAALLEINNFKDIIIDQTLYWTIVPTEQEAFYRVGLINSDSLTEAIRKFNPEGELGPRHLHTLPSRIIPSFDVSNRQHIEIADLAKHLSTRGRVIAKSDIKISSPATSIASRRKVLRRKLKLLSEFTQLENVSTNVLAASQIG